ncbi:MAG: hypothetical protein K6F00_10395 [Lachnospiraceae bacterium]|nr:hypothetical protein [Lachnospiraceae bacterium]
MKKKDRLEDIKLDESELHYTYQGGYYVWAEDEKSLVKYRTTLFAYLTVPVILFLICGFLPNSGMDGVPLLIIPFAIAFVIYILMWYKTVRFFAAGDKIRKYVFEETAGRFSMYGQFAVIVSGLGCMAIPILIIMKSFVWVMPGSILYLLTMISSVACGVMFSRDTAGMEDRYRFLE